MPLLSKLLYFFNRRDKIQAIGLLFMMLLGASFDALGVGLVMPFISIINNPGIVHSQKYLRRLYELGGFQSERDFLIGCGAGLLAVYLIKNAYLALLFYTQYRFLFAKNVALARRLLAAYLYSPYSYHLQRNSAQLLRNISSEIQWVFDQVMVPLALVCIESMVVVVIVTVMIIAEPVAALGAISVLGGASVLLYSAVRRRTGNLGKEKQQAYGQMIQWINQGLGGVKEAKVLGREEFFVDAYHSSALRYSRAHRFFKTTQELPRLCTESLAIGGLLFVVVLMLRRGQDMQSVMPVLALFAMAALRLMPSANRIMTSLTAIRYYTPSVNVIYEDLKALERVDGEEAQKRRAREASVPMDLSSAIELKDLCFQYPGTDEAALRGISVTIPKGHSVAFVGSSGAGKSTLIDVMLGLLPPTSGQVLIDGLDIHQGHVAAWQRKIGYIPQPIYLSDDTIRRNIAFGLRDAEINEDTLREALQAAQLEDFIGTLPEGLETIVGERGVRLSGGQRQRIGIARALYHNPEVLVMDEATSALDNETESEITKAIAQFSRQKTVIIIAHRLTTVQHCDTLFVMKHGQIIESGTYAELLANSPDFQNMVRGGA